MRWPLQPLQPLQQTQLQPPFGQSVDSLCHPWFTTTNVSYRFPILKLPPPPCAVLLVLGNRMIQIYHTSAIMSLLFPLWFPLLCPHVFPIISVLFCDFCPYYFRIFSLLFPFSFPYDFPIVFPCVSLVCPLWFPYYVPEHFSIIPAGHHLEWLYIYIYIYICCDILEGKWWKNEEQSEIHVYNYIYIYVCVLYIYMIMYINRLYVYMGRSWE